MNCSAAERSEMVDQINHRVTVINLITLLILQSEQDAAVKARQSNACSPAGLECFLRAAGLEVRVHEKRLLDLDPAVCLLSCGAAVWKAAFGTKWFM